MKQAVGVTSLETAETTSSRPEAPTVRIRPSRGFVPLRLHEVWEYRELLYFLCWRTIKVRYKQTVLGGTWAILQPLVTMVVFSVIFGRLVGVPSDGIPYPIFAYAGLLPWQLFAQSLTESGNSLVNNERLVTKVYFPRLVIPASTVLVSLLDFAVAGLILAGLMVYYRIPPAAGIWILPFLVIQAVSAALGIGLWLSALNVRYRDIRHVIPFLTQCWLFVTPIAYPSSLVPRQWRVLLGLNPMTGVVEGFRWALLGAKADVGGLLALSALITAALLVSGAIYFRRMERTFADIL
jgi:lipopolysaccharide transport system permease protein